MRNESKKTIKLKWAIIQCWYTMLALVTVVITGEWLMFWAIMIVCLGYGWGWYRCWCFHKIGWEESEPEKLISVKEVRDRVTHSWYCNKCLARLNSKDDVRYNDSVCPLCGHMSRIGFPADIHRRLDKDQ